MTLEEAKAFLNGLVRSELRDHAFGDREITWCDSAGKERADGYSGSTGTFVSIYSEKEDEHGDPLEIGDFEGRDALQLLKCGSEGLVERNDSTGPDNYQDGQCMPGLTLKGVRDELTK